MTETQKRIEAYKKALPEIRERVIAVALLFAMSMAMMTSATFAWLTISRAPEVTAVNTTVAANGNLEIALATGNGTTAPGESKVGDSSAAKGQSVTAANITWGNLVNLSDPSYGLDNLIMRPALLNSSELLTNPLFSAQYDDDGRVVGLKSGFEYTSWVMPTATTEGYFGLAEKMGVRAVSSTKATVTGFAYDLQLKRDTANGTNAMAKTQLLEITRDGDYQNLLASLVSIHMTAEMNGEDKYKNATITAEQLEQMIEMYNKFKQAFEKEIEAISQALDAQYFSAYGGNTAAYDKPTVESVLAISQYDSSGNYVNKINVEDNGKVTEKEIKIINLKKFLDNYKTICENYEKLIKINESRSDTNIWNSSGVMWTKSKLNQIVNDLMDVDECLVKKTTETKYQKVKDFIAGIKNNPTSALGYMNAKCDIVITNGPLYEFEQRAGGDPIDISGLKVTAKMMVSALGNREFEANITAYITTNAASPFYFMEDLNHSKTLNTGASSSGGTVQALDTYALAIDLWARTNQKDSILTLEGNVILSNPYYVNVTGKDDEGNTVDLYTLTLSGEDENGESYSATFDVYQKNDKWYDATNHDEITADVMGNATPILKQEEKRDVIGFEGENRVWDESKGLSLDATTQGGGSCYIYYADTPEDQAKSLELLEAFKVAFIDASGRLMATAVMDTENHYSQSGRVIVPLVVSNDGVYISDDEYGITALEEDTPVRITALVYLDGSMLGNENVLSAADIQGQLNIQFGSSKELVPIDDEKIESAVRSVSATLSKDSFDYDTATEPMTTTVTITVNGEQPKTMTAFFMRYINEHQGTREPGIMTFNKTGEATWTADYTFKTPGVYVLRTVQLDGVEYDLTPPADPDNPDAKNDPPKVTVSGFAVNSFYCPQANESKYIEVITDANYTTADFTLGFVTDKPEKMPKKVEGRFLKEDGSAVNIEFYFDNNSKLWKGTANFTSSGDYTLQYLLLDGKYMELPENFWHTASIRLGMLVSVFTTSPEQFLFAPGTEDFTENMQYLKMQVSIMDNAGEKLTGIALPQLNYISDGNRTMNATLRWNASSGYYEGELATEIGGPGLWRFLSVEAGDNIITKADRSPTFRIVSPEPPSYVGHGTGTDIFAPNGGVNMSVNLRNSSGVSVMAVIENTYTDVTHEVPANPTTSGADGVLTYTFTLPAKDGSQDGNWIMKEVHIWDYYDADSEAYVKQEDAMIVPISDYSFKVVNTPNYRISKGTIEAEFNGTFMQEHTIKDIRLDIVDFEGAPVDASAVVELKFNYDYGSTQSNGGYSLPGNIVPDFSIEFEGSGATYTQKDPVTVKYAGKYTPNFTVNGRAVNAADLEFTVKSIAPTVTIDSISPSGLHTTFDKPNEGNKNVTSSINGNTATVHVESSRSGDNVTINTVPSVTLKLSNIGEAESATMIFSNNTNNNYMYTNDNRTGQTDSYTWTKNENTSTRYFGQYVTGWCNSLTYNYAGTFKSSKVTLVYGGNSYDFSVDEITIINEAP